ncbi:Protein FAM193A [Frankliniella fusca]|uniref:Protein FAM193A n=1 Tax=Frankliniella fusca TaxID=407009 RepID=A0AAE1I0I8_9NEOP|nr:Protein FAM193A [Frankliniella fusca]
MGDVLGKEGREDQLSDQNQENTERAEAEGAEAEEELPTDRNTVAPESSCSPGGGEQCLDVRDNLISDCELDENERNQAKEDHHTSASEAEKITNESPTPPCDDQSGAPSKNLKLSEPSLSPVILVPEETNVQKTKDIKSNSDDAGVYDVEESESDVDGVADADDEDGFEDDDEYEDYDDEDDEDDDDDDDEDEEGGMDADDEDDFGENDVQSPRKSETLVVDEMQTKRSEEIKINSDCVYSYSDSSDDSALRTKNKSGGRICDSMRRRKLMKAKDCAAPRSNISNQVDQTAMLSEAMTNLKLDNSRLEICDGNDNTIIQRLTSEAGYSTSIQEETTAQEDLMASESILLDGYQGQELPPNPVKTEDIVPNEEGHTSLNEEDIKELMRKEALQRQKESCTCESCESKRITLGEQRKLQAAWMELRHFVREVYRIIMQTAPDDCMPIVDSSQDEHMITIARRLTQSDPHQLYHRLQAQVHEVATAVKVRLKDISEDHHQDSLVATDFFEGLFYCYDKVSAAAKRVAPILEDLESKHLSRFNLTWELLNKAIYFQVVYNDSVISQKLPEMIALVTDKGQEFQGMIRFYMAFDDEMSIIQAMWRESFELLQKYNTNQAKIRAKQQMLLRDWEVFKAQRQRVQKASVEGMELINRHGPAALAVVETGSDCEEYIEVVVCPSCNIIQPCPCDECCLSHLFSCRAHQARLAELSPTLERMASDGAGDEPAIIGSEDRHGYGILRSTYGPSYYVPAELHPPPLRAGPKPCPFGCYCREESETVPNHCPAPDFPEQIGGYGDGPGVYSQHNSVDAQHPHFGNNQFQSTKTNHCHSYTDKDQANIKCVKQSTSNKLISSDVQHFNGVTKVELAGNNTLPFSPPGGQVVVQPQPQPRLRFTAGPGVNVPDTDNFPDPPADFAIPPTEFSGEVKTGAATKSNEPVKTIISRTGTTASFSPVSPSTKIGSLTSNGQEPIFVLTKAGAAPPSHIPSLQGKSVPPKEKRLSSSVPCTPPSTPPSSKSAPSGPTIQGLLEEALERKKAEMARAAAATASPQRTVVSPPSGPLPQPLLATAQAKPKVGHTCSSAKHKQHTHSPSHRDPKNCDCCFCEMFGHGAPPAAPTSHRFHENRQRLRSKLNKSRASKQQAVGGRAGAGASAVAAGAKSAAPGAAAAAAQRPQAAAASAARPAPAAAPAATLAAAAGAPKVSMGATASARPSAVGAPAAPAAGSPGASLVVKTAVPPLGAAGTSARVSVPGAPASGEAVTPGVTSSGAAAARAMAFNATSGLAQTGSAFIPTGGKAAVTSSVHTMTQSQGVRPSHVAAAKLAEAGMNKAKTQPVSGSKSIVTSSNQRLISSASTAGKGNQAPARGTTQATQTAPVAQKKVVTPPPPAPPKEEPPKKEDPRPIDELLDFIEGSSSSQQKAADSKKAAKKARQKQKKLDQQREEEVVQTPDVTITMLKESDAKGKGKKGSSKQTEEVISTIPSATAQSIRDRIKSQVGEVAKKMGTSDQPQMVTIRRVMEPNSSEPTVTITLKGATPDKDKVLFTLVNGQNEVVCHDQASSVPKTKKQRKLERRLLRQQQQQQILVEEGNEEEEEEAEFVEEEEAEEEIDLSQLTKTQRKKLRRLQRKQEEERLAEEERLREEEERLRIEEEKRRMEEEERLQQQRGRKNSKKEKAQKTQPQPTPQTNSKKNQKTNSKCQPGTEQKSAGKGSKVNSAPDSDEEFIVPVQMTKKERKKARKVQQLLEEEQRRQRQKEEEEKERQRQLELKEQKKKQKENQKLKQQQQKLLEKQQQKQKEIDKKQQPVKQSQQKQQLQNQQQQQQKQKQKQTPSKQQQQQQQQPTTTSKRGGRITTSIIPNPLTLGSYMPPVGSLEWTTQALAASRPSVTIQPASVGSSQSSLGGLEQRFSTTLTLNGKPIMPPPRQPSPEPTQDFSLENLKLPPGITITKVDPSQVAQRKPPVSKPQVTKTVVPNPPPTTIIAAPLSGNRPSGNYSSSGGQDPNSNVIVVDTGKLKQDIARREEEPEQVVTRKKKNNKNRKAQALAQSQATEPSARPQQPSQLPPFIYGMNSVSITPAGQPPPLMATPAPPPQAAIIKMNGNMVTIRNPAIHPTPQRYIGPDESVSRKPNSTSNSGPSLHQNRKENSNLPPRFANAKIAQQANGMNGFVPELNTASHRGQHFNPPTASHISHASHSSHPSLVPNTPQTSQTFEVSKPSRLQYDPPPRHFEPRPFETQQTPHVEVSSHRHFESSAIHHYDAAPRQHFDPGCHIETSSRSFEHPHMPRHYESPGHHFEHPGHLFNPTPQQMTAPAKHVIPQNYAAAIEGKKNKLKSNDDWQLLDNVFAPKDIDLDDGDIDDDERELEAFKRFCLQSVPPKRKEKVHLNIEDIVLKKKSSAVSCT